MHGRGLKSYVAALGGGGTSIVEPSAKGKEKVWVRVGLVEVQNPVKAHRDSQNGWVPPKPGWVKLNVDASFGHDSELASIGVVVRDHQGQVILSAWRFLEHVASAEEAEALACLVTNWVRQPTVLESDCLSLIKSLHSPDPNRASCLGIIKEIKELNQLLPDCCFNHVRSEGNQVKHNLAQLAKRSKQCKVMRFSTPLDVRKTVELDAKDIVVPIPGCNSVSSFPGGPDVSNPL
jgi:hypothetical protein